ncbi:hypothetical protein HK105_208040 [Polyrhizophydium stewartii]|uniref:Ankyrin repeat protein n=1 Tax=Polyrhizophydium stewartii TaxID=2732419 RepID=A0ABR4MZ19_9FUNG
MLSGSPKKDGGRMSHRGSEAAIPTEELQGVVLALSQGLESLHLQLDQHHAVGKALCEELAAKTDSGTTLLADGTEPLANLSAEALAQRETIARLHASMVSHHAANAGMLAQVNSLESQLHAVQTLVASMSLTEQRTAQQLPAESTASKQVTHVRAAVAGSKTHLSADAASLWDKLPAALCAKILELSSELTKLANGMVHPLEIKTMRNERLEQLWIDAMQCDWQGDLRVLPAPQMGVYEHAIRSRGMLTRLRKLKFIDDGVVQKVALKEGWEDLLDREKYTKVAVAAAAFGRIDVLEQMFEALGVTRNVLSVVIVALACGQHATADWILAHLKVAIPDIEIPAIYRDPVARTLLSEPPKNELEIWARLSAIDSDRQGGLNAMRFAGANGDVVALELLCKCFGMMPKSVPWHFKVGSIGMINWLRSHGMLDPPELVVALAFKDCNDVKTLEYMYETLGIAADKKDLICACRSNNRPAAALLMTRHGICVDQSVVIAAVKYCAVDVINLVVERKPEMANQIINTAVSVDTLETEIPPTELVEYLYARHPQGFRQNTLAAAIKAALKYGHVSTVAFLLDSVTTADWDLDAAKLMVDGSEASRNAKKRLGKLIGRTAARRASQLSK